MSHGCIMRGHFTLLVKQTNIALRIVFMFYLKNKSSFSEALPIVYCRMVLGFTP